ncbi:MAG TPA: hypothetical protein VKA86_12415 [Candidatus Krumholzibacteria bacterium]|nr:hypothetical protein [Candidatus Krumholzibacteria bacterium]
MRRVAVVGLLLLVASVGCRDLVGPGAVEDLEFMRTIEGRITGVEGFRFGVAQLSFQNQRYVSDADSVLGWTILTDERGHFTTSVPRGTGGLADVEIDWVDVSELEDVVLVGVPLAGRTMELAYDAAVFEGRVEWPAAMDVELRSNAELEFFRIDEPGFWRIAEVEPDVRGAFRAVLPRAVYGLRLLAETADRSTRVAASWPPVVASTAITLDVPCVQRPFDLEAPGGLPDAADLGLSTRRATVTPGEDGILAEAVFDLASPPDSVWVVADPDGIHVGADAVNVVRPGLGPLGPDVDADVPLVLDLGEATLRVDVVRSGTLQERVDVTLYGPDVGTAYEYPFDPEPVYFTVPLGLYRLTVVDTDTGDMVTRFVDVQGTTQVVVDLDAVSGGG